jgi:hypothetical protein
VPPSADAKARLPRFIIGGAPRSGTTFAAALLDQHPEIYVGKPYVPEAKVFMTPAEGGAAGFKSRYARLFEPADSAAVLGEKTSYYLENEQVVPRALATLSDDAHFIFVLREPVARAVSNYLWSRHNGLETLPFADAIALEGRRESTLPPEQSYARPFDYMTRGHYAAFAQRYFEAFGRDRVHFLLFEDIALRPEAFCHAIQLAAQVDPLPLNRFRYEPVNVLAQTLAIAPALEAALRERIRPEVERLAAMTGLDVSRWGY